MQELDRERPMEAVHRKSGKVGTVRTLDQSKALCVGEGIDTWTAYFDKYGQPKDDFCPWTVRNVAISTVDWSKFAWNESHKMRPNKTERSYITTAPDTIPIDRALWERVEGLVRGMADHSNKCTPPQGGKEYAEARAIVALLPAVEVDGDLLAAREIIAHRWPDHADRIETGNYFDDSEIGTQVAIALAAIRKGRELEAGR